MKKKIFFIKNSQIYVLLACANDLFYYKFSLAVTHCLDAAAACSKAHRVHFQQLPTLLSNEALDDNDDAIDYSYVYGII